MDRGVSERTGHPLDDRQFRHLLALLLGQLSRQHKLLGAGEAQLRQRDSRPLGHTQFPHHLRRAVPTLFRRL